LMKDNAIQHSNHTDTKQKRSHCCCLHVLLPTSFSFTSIMASSGIKMPFFCPQTETTRQFEW
jgi:hypothetical protein